MLAVLIDVEGRVAARFNRVLGCYGQVAGHV